MTSKITHIRVGKTDKEVFARFAKRNNITSSKAFSLLLRRVRLK